MPTTNQHSDDTLFQIEEIEGYKITPLSFGKLTLISQDLIPLVDKIADAFPQLTMSPSLTLRDIIKIAFFILPDITPILAKVLDVPTKEIENLRADVAVKIAAAVWRLNKEVLINFFSIGFGETNS